MSWQDDLLPASIGGADFFALSVSSSVGRRTVVTEFPGRDGPGHEDLGRKARRWSIEGCVLGDEYMLARDAVIDVLESPGPHKFTHPWWGELSVVLDDGSALQITETVNEGGIARFSFAVVESGEGTDLRIVPSPAADLAVAVASVVAAADKDLKKKLKKPGILSAIAGCIGKIADVMQAVRRKTLGALSGIDDLTDALTDLKDAKNLLAGLPDAIMSKINGLLASLSGLVRKSHAADTSDFPGDKKVRVDVALQASADLQAEDMETPPPFEGVPVDEDEAEAERDTQRAFRAAAVANYALLFVDLPLESKADSAKVLDGLGDAIEALLLDPEVSDESYLALADLRTALGAQLAAAAQDLPLLTTYTPTASLPALLLAYYIHGDPTRDLEIVGRNGVADPNFVTGGEPLEVLLG
jgi:prophage DNA circulation protein